jgi:hypothetical protein
MHEKGVSDFLKPFPLSLSLSPRNIIIVVIMIDNYGFGNNYSSSFSRPAQNQVNYRDTGWSKKVYFMVKIVYPDLM